MAMQIGVMSHRGIRNEESSATFYLGAGLTSVAQVGVPVAVTGNFTVDVAADGAEIVGVLESFENRVQEGIKVGAVNWHNCAKFTYTGTAPVAGGRIVGAGGGNVKAAGAGAGLQTLVTAVDTTAMTVEVIFR